MFFSLNTIIGLRNINLDKIKEADRKEGDIFRVARKKKKKNSAKTAEVYIRRGRVICCRAILKLFFII